MSKESAAIRDNYSRRGHAHSLNDVRGLTDKLTELDESLGRTVLDQNKQLLQLMDRADLQRTQGNKTWNLLQLMAVIYGWLILTALILIVVHW